MSAPIDPSAGRALNANQAPSGEYPAPRPTIVTLVRIANALPTVGSGLALPAGAADSVMVSLDIGLGDVTPVGLAEAVASGVASRLTVGAGKAVVSVVALATDGEGLPDAIVSLGAGSAGGSGVGSATTITASAPAASVPTTMAWSLTGDWNTNFGVVVRVTRR